MNVNDLRCMACEIVIKMSKSSDSNEEIVAQLKLLEGYVRGMVEIVEKENTKPSQSRGECKYRQW